MQIRRAQVAVVALVAAVTAGCGDRAGTAGAGDVDLDGSWHLVTGSDAQGTFDLTGRDVTLVVEGDEVGGTSACNHYFGTVTVDGEEVTFGGLGGTEMGCDPPVMDLEQRYLTALAAVEQGVRTRDDLTLLGPDVSLDLALEPPVEDAPLTGTIWRLTSLIEGETASSVLGDASLTFGRDGSLEGSTGCREVRGRYDVEGSRFSVGAFEAGADRCPAGLRRQHRHVVAVLDGVYFAAVEGNRLTLSGEAGKGLDLTAG